MDIFHSLDTAQTLYFLADMIGTIAFAVSGVLLAARLNMDFIGVLVLAFLPACGGGTVRDLLLGVTPFWMKDSTYLLAVIITAILGQLFVQRFSKKERPRWILPTFDALGLAVFTVTGANKAFDANFGWEVAVVMGALTGCGGGLLRDVVANIPPAVLKEELYATISIIGGLIFVAITSFMNPLVAGLIAGAFVFFFRVIAWANEWALPKLRID